MELNEALKQRIVRIDFTKVDGTNRIMHATLNPDLIEFVSDKKDSSENTRKVKDGILVVFDVDKNGWRSMRVESINNWK